MLPVLKDLFAEKENLIEITSCNKEHYQYPGYQSSNHSNVLYYTLDVTQLLHYSESQLSHWDQAPRNTNGLERANGLVKSGTSKISLFAAMQSLYEKDKMFALQYLAVSEISSKISY